MDEREWLDCTDPRPMLEFLQGRTSERKLRLFACACCRSIWHVMTDERCRRAVELSEGCADHRRDEWEILEAWNAIQGAINPALHLTNAGRSWPALTAEATDPRSPAMEVAEDTASCAREAALQAKRGDMAALREEETAQSDLLRDIFANPFRIVAVGPNWRTPTVLALADAAYANRTLSSGILEADRLAILADALEEAGCTDAYILGHLRGRGPHVRGCFVIDALLDKK
jgi:hypothetical protein